MGLVSDDESVAGPDIQNTSRRYVINQVNWRNQKITTAMRYLDMQIPQSRPQRSAGNVARERIFSNGRRTPALKPRNGKTTIQGGRKGLPVNYYDQGWLNSLSNDERLRLNAKPEREWDRAGVFR